MKKQFLLAVLLFSFVAMAQIRKESIKDIGDVVIRSKIVLPYGAREAKSDTIYVSVQKFSLDPVANACMTRVVDYVKDDRGGYEVINEKSKKFTNAQIDGLFSQMGNSILPSESWADEMKGLLKIGLLLETQTNLFEDGKTIYKGAPTDWEIVN